MAAVSAIPKTIPKSAAMSKAPPAHPTYLQMVTEAVSSLKERTGSSSLAIAKHIESKHKNDLPVNFRKILSTQLKNMAKQGKLLKVKNSFKLSQIVKTAKVKSTVPAKPKPAKVKSAKAKVAAKSPKKVKPAAKEGSSSKELKKKAVVSKASVPKKATVMKKSTPKKAGRPKKTATLKKAAMPKPVKEKKVASAEKAPMAKKSQK